MNKRLKIILVLTIFALISGGILSIVYLISSPLIEANVLEEQNKSIFKVIPEAKSYEEKVKDDIKYFVCKDSEGNIVGIALPAKGNGYQGTIKLMIGLTSDLKQTTGIEILEQVETPGLGGRISEDSFQKQFKGVYTQPAIGYVKNKRPEKTTDIQAITGATISSRSVIAIINKNIKKLSSVLNQGE